MNKKELSQLYYLNREIEEQQRRLYELESLVTSASSCITGMPKVKWTNDKVAQYACEIADLKSLLDLNLKKCFYELSRLNRYIDSVADNEISQILALRYINGLSWEQVAAHISHYATADSVRTCLMMELDPKYVDVIVNRYVGKIGNSNEVFLLRDGEKILFADLQKSID